MSAWNAQILAFAALLYSNRIQRTLGSRIHGGNYDHSSDHEDVFCNLHGSHTARVKRRRITSTSRRQCPRMRCPNSNPQISGSVWGDGCLQFPSGDPSCREDQDKKKSVAHAAIELCCTRSVCAHDKAGVLYCTSSASGNPKLYPLEFCPTVSEGYPALTLPSDVLDTLQGQTCKGDEGDLDCRA